MKNSKINYFIIFFSVILLASGLFIELNIYDEAIPLVGSELVNNGGNLYQDFWTIYSPGQFYFMSFFKSLGVESVFAFRVISLIISLGICSVLYLFARKFFTRFSSALIFFIPALLLSNANFFSRSILSSLLLAFLSVFVLFAYLREPKTKFLLIAGGLMGLTAVFRHDMGGYLFGMEFQAIFFASLSHAFAKDLPTKQKIIYGLKNALIFTSGLVFVLPIALYFIATVPFDLLWENLIKIPITIFREYRNLSFPNFEHLLSDLTTSTKIRMTWETIAFFLPLITYILTILSIIIRVKTKKLVLNGTQFWYEMTLFNLGINLYNQAMVRSDFEHAIPTFIVSVLLAFIFIKEYVPVKFRYFAMLIYTFFVMSLPVSYKIKQIRETYSSIDIKNNRAFLLNMKSENGETYTQLLNYIINNTNDDEYIYSGVSDHDDFMLNDVMLYYLTKRKCPNKYYELHPGITTQDNVQSEILNSLIDKDVRLIILLDSSSNGEYEIKENKNILDNYINNNYKLEKTINQYKIYIKR